MEAERESSFWELVEKVVHIGGSLASLVAIFVTAQADKTEAGYWNRIHLLSLIVFLWFFAAFLVFWRRSRTEIKLAKKETAERPEVVANPTETIRRLKDLIIGASREILLLRIHNMGGDDLQDDYEELRRRLRDDPDIVVRRLILLRDDKITRDHLAFLADALDGSVRNRDRDCQVRFLYAAALGLNLAITEKEALVGIPRSGSRFYRGLHYTKEEDLAILKAAFFALWNDSEKCEEWLKSSEGLSKKERDARLKAAFEKLNKVEDLIKTRVML